MDWTALMARLKDRGWTQVALAQRLGVSQSTLSDLHRGDVKDPRYSLAARLIDLDATAEVAPVADAKAAA